jgi:hypothetical protein
MWRQPWGCLAGQAAVAAFLALGAGTGPAVAAVRHCQPYIVGQPAVAKSAAEARKLALQSWTLSAAVHGEEYVSWRIANNKSIACVAVDGGLHRCQASGNPCRIQQVPAPPQPATPQVVPKTKRIGI